MQEKNAYCKKCGRPIQFLRMKSGKLMPVDGFSFQIVPSDRGSVYFKEDGTSVHGVPVSVQGPKSVKAWQSHFVTCPESEAFKNRKREETWNETQARLIQERIEKKNAEEAEAAARRAEKEKKEAARRAFEESQLSIFAV